MFIGAPGVKLHKIVQSYKLMYTRYGCGKLPWQVAFIFSIFLFFSPGWNCSVPGNRGVVCKYRRASPIVGLCSFSFKMVSSFATVKKLSNLVLEVRADVGLLSCVHCYTRAELKNGNRSRSVSFRRSVNPDVNACTFSKENVFNAWHHLLFLT